LLPVDVDLIGRDAPKRLETSPPRHGHGATYGGERTRFPWLNPSKSSDPRSLGGARYPAADRATFRADAAVV